MNDRKSLCCPRCSQLKSKTKSRFIADVYWESQFTEKYGVHDGAAKQGGEVEEDGTYRVRDRRYWYVQGLPHLHFAKQLAYILNVTSGYKDE